MFERIVGWFRGWGYWIVVRTVIMVLWTKHYVKKGMVRMGMMEARGASGGLLSHKNGEPFVIKVVDIVLYSGGRAVVWDDGWKDDVIKRLEVRGDLLWEEMFKDGESGVSGVSGESESNEDMQLVIDYTIDGSRYKVLFDYASRWEYPISFPMYTYEEFDREWRSKDYKHSVLSAEVVGKDGVGKDVRKDVTEMINMFMGPMGDLCKGRTVEYKAGWLMMCSGEDGGNRWNRLEIIDNSANDYDFGRDDLIILEM